MNVEPLNRVAEPFGLKLSSVASISSQETRAAPTPAPKAQRRTLPGWPLPGLAATVAGTAEPPGFASVASDGRIGVESCVSIGDDLVDEQGWILRRTETDVKQAPVDGDTDVGQIRVHAILSRSSDACGRRRVHATFIVARQFDCTSIKACPESIRRIECVGALWSRY